MSLLACLASTAFIACGGGGDAPAPATGTATLTWLASPDQVSGYRVYYGTAPRTYFQSMGAGMNVTKASAVVSDLQSGVTYYFAVTAVNTAGLESDYSNEASKSFP